MEIISILDIESKIDEKNNLLNYYKELKWNTLSRVLPSSKELSKVQVSSSKDVTKDALLEYAIEIENIDNIINQLEKDLDNLVRLRICEINRLKKYDKADQLVIYYKSSGKSWREIEIMIDKREISCSLRTAKRVWRKYKEKKD